MNGYFPVGMAIFDFLPNIAFMIGAFFIIKITAVSINRNYMYIAITGSLLITIGGLLKALWKLIYFVNAVDIE